MAKRTVSSNPYLEQPCDRCGSKRFISRTWQETIETFSGSVTVDCDQIDCTNVECQALFDKNLKAEEAKKEQLKRKKEESELLRKAQQTK